MDDDRLEELLREHARRNSATSEPIARETILERARLIGDRRDRRLQAAGKLIGLVIVVLISVVVLRVGGKDRDPLPYAPVRDGQEIPTLEVLADDPLNGDAQAFVNILDPTTGQYVDHIVIKEMAQKFRVRVYVQSEGDVKQALETTTANLRVRCNVPSSPGTTVIVSCSITGDGLGSRQDETRFEFVNPDPATPTISAVYVKGSTRVLVKDQPTTQPLADDLVGPGVLLTPNGTFPSGAQAVIQFEVAVYRDIQRVGRG